jgi:alpha-mannosidase
VEQHEQLSSAVCNGDDVLDWSNARLDRAQAVARSAAHEAMRDIASRIAAKLPGRPVVVFNRLNWETHDVVAVKLPEGETNFRILDDAGREVPSAMKSAAEPEGIAFAASAPGLGYRTYYLASGGAVKTTRPQKKSNARIGLSIENEFYRLKVAPRTGLVVSLFDKTLRQELIDPARPAGGFRLVEDKGKDWHESHPTGKVWRQGDYSNSTVTIELTPLGQELVARGPLLGEGEANFGKFREARYRLAAGIPRLDIAIRYSWDADKSRRAWLMFDLPLALSKVKATYGTPYGAWDYREFAGSQPTLQRIRTMHNWCDLYEPDAGVGVTVAGPSTQLELNDDGLAIALTSRHGDTSGDLCIGLDGEHSFHYAMRSHRGDWRESQAVRFGAEHEAGRSPMGAVLATPRGGSLPATQTLLHVNGEHLVVTALKQAHEGEDIVLRLYEADGKPDVLSLPEVSRQGIAAAWESNIVEDRVAPLTPAALEQVHVAPWEIISLRLGLVSRGGEEKDWKQ